MASFIKGQASDYFMDMQYNTCSEEFFQKIEQNLETINLFFAEKVSFCSRKFQEIDQAVNQIKGNVKGFPKEARKIKEAIAEFYLMVKKVEAYQVKEAVFKFSV